MCGWAEANLSHLFCLIFSFFFPLYPDITKLLFNWQLIHGWASQGFSWGTNSWGECGGLILCQCSKSGTTVPRIPFWVQPWAGVSHRRLQAQDLEVGSDATAIIPSFSKGWCRAWGALAALACFHFICWHPLLACGNSCQTPSLSFSNSWVREKI